MRRWSVALLVVRRVPGGSALKTWYIDSEDMGDAWLRDCYDGKALVTREGDVCVVGVRGVYRLIPGDNLGLE